MTTGQELGLFKGHWDRVYSVAVWLDGKLVASAGIDNTVRLWEAATGKEIRCMEGGAVQKWVTSLAFSTEGRILASAREDGTIRMCQFATGKEIRSLVGHEGAVNSIAISPDGRNLASGGDDSTIRVWKLDTGQELRRFTGLGRVRSVAFSPDGRTLVSGDDGAGVCLWEIASGQEIRTFRGHIEQVTCVAFAPDGRSVASGSRDFTILLWDVTGWLADCRNAPGVDVLWKTLMDGKAATAHRAQWQLVRAGSQSVRFLQHKLRTLEPVPKKRITRLLADLDSDRFVVREKAHRELERLAELAVPALREALAGRPSLELRLRADRLLSQILAPVPPPHRLRLGRALAVLEQINNSQACELLQRLGKGAENAWLTQEARASLQRLGKR